MHVRKTRFVQVGKTATKFVIATTIAATIATMPVSAQEPFASLNTLGQPVEDDLLADIRGKFISRDNISFFGVSMITSWQDESGVTTVARLVFNVDFLNQGNGGAQPQLLVGWVRDGDPDMDVVDSHTGYTPYLIAQQVLPVGSIDETSGVAQANVIAGADNAALNGMQIALVPASTVSAMDTAGLTPIFSTTGVDFADGDRLEFSLADNRIGVSLTGNGGVDSTMQAIGGNMGNLLQQTVLNSDRNSVLNNTAIIVGTEGVGSGFDAVRATEALSAMKGHGF